MLLFFNSTCQISQKSLNYSHFPQATCSFNTCWDGVREPAVPSCRSLLLHRKHLLFTQQMSWSQTWWKMSREVIRTTFGRELMARKSENGSRWGEEKVESKHSLPRLLLFLLFFLVCRSFVLPPYLFSFLYLNLLIFPFSIFFLRWRAKWKMKAASVSSHIPSSRPPIFSCTSKSPKQVGLCVLILPLHLSTQHRAPSFQPFSVSWTLSANLFSVLTSFLCPKYVCWPVVPSIILFLYSVSL